jgi:hypothetical protein
MEESVRRNMSDASALRELIVSSFGENKVFANAAKSAVQLHKKGAALYHRALFSVLYDFRNVTGSDYLQKKVLINAYSSSRT